jgi:putative copper export protein
MDDATLAALRTAASALFDIGLATMIGALATAALLRDASSAWAAQRRRRCQRLFTLACTATLVASVAWMELQAITITELSPGPALQAVAGIVVDTLDVKLGLVAAAVALGSFSRIVVMPALLATTGSPSPWRRFTGVLRLEAVVLLAALVAAALLANGEPPAV